MERTVVRCAEGHVFSTASFPMQTGPTGSVPGGCCGARVVRGCGTRARGALEAVAIERRSGSGSDAAETQ